MDLNKIPKQFCENISVGYSPENFVIALMAGEGAVAYALTPQHAKRLAQYLNHQVTEFEAAFGPIDAKWSPGIESPLQTKDIKGSGV